MDKLLHLDNCHEKKPNSESLMLILFEKYSTKLWQLESNFFIFLQTRFLLNTVKALSLYFVWLTH